MWKNLAQFSRDHLTSAGKELCLGHRAQLCGIPDYTGIELSGTHCTQEMLTSTVILLTIYIL